MPRGFSRARVAFFPRGVIFLLNTLVHTMIEHHLELHGSHVHLDPAGFSNRVVWSKVDEVSVLLSSTMARSERHASSRNRVHNTYSKYSRPWGPKIIWRYVVTRVARIRNGCPGGITEPNETILGKMSGSSSSHVCMVGGVRSARLKTENVATFDASSQLQRQT